MARRNIMVGYDLVGWFNDKAKDHILLEEGTRFDGSNRISLATGNQWDHEALHLTGRNRRWVLNAWSKRQGGGDVYHLITEADAFRWLLMNERADEAMSVLPADIAARLASYLDEMEA